MKNLPKPRSAEVRFAPSAEIATASLERVVGRAEMPEPGTMSLKQWRAIPSANLRIEREVEQYIVEPLLRFCGIPKGALTATRQVRTQEGIPDYTIAIHRRTLAVVEVKQRIAAPRLFKHWTALSDHQQLCRYAGHFACNGMLVDCDQVILFNRPRMQFLRRYERRFLTSAEVMEIRGFLLAEGDAEQRPLHRRPNLAVNSTVSEIRRGLDAGEAAHFSLKGRSGRGLLPGCLAVSLVP